jgi:hypothetical protein
VIRITQSRSLIGSKTTRRRLGEQFSGPSRVPPEVWAESDNYRHEQPCFFYVQNPKWAARDRHARPDG